eukprot:CAMPEP_0184312542 /NCGR_PEP_ID=MMETSP1049-20130417/50660_1 /TAXON_ID=77928 /ORGANISM="Proteomonas sulcata, Strain CCMP704" /LENGTH=215 /DNA_ID=CAMNT_0026628777 /DNA_START=859 /DNA_END=1503 /DNA_ORIENTATION=+
MRSKVPTLESLFHSDALVNALQKKLPELKLLSGTKARTLKVQMNKGNGGCFPLHYDNPGRPNMRKLTCLLYLNSDWKEGDGGELQIVPFLSDPVKIHPLMDRMVIFRSDLLLHKVFPSVAERFCLTIWIDAEQGAVNTDDDVLLKISKSEVEDDLEGLVAKMRISPMQRAVSRAVYRDEYETSLRDCMKGAEGCKEMLQSHQLHIQAVKSNPGLW